MEEIITWDAFKAKFLEKYFTEDLCKCKERKFLDLKQGGMTVGE